MSAESLRQHWRLTQDDVLLQPNPRCNERQPDSWSNPQNDSVGGISHYPSLWPHYWFRLPSVMNKLTTWPRRRLASTVSRSKEPSVLILGRK